MNQKVWSLWPAALRVYDVARARRLLTAHRVERLSTMVFYFTCSDPRYTMYMGRDKHENEHLIAHGWPEDLWFHVDGHSSAHVYLRLPKGESIKDVPEAVVQECSQLTKANSIEGCKLANVKIIYTMWSNLRKAAGMADGQVGYHDRRAVMHTVVEHRNNATVNRLTKTRVERDNNPRELAELRAARDAAESAAEASVRKERYKREALEREETRRQEELEREASKTAAAQSDELTEAMNRRFQAMGQGHKAVHTTTVHTTTAPAGGSDLDVDLFGGGGALMDVSDMSYKGRGKAGKAKAEALATSAMAAAAKLQAPAATEAQDDWAVIDDGDGDWLVGGGDPLSEALEKAAGSAGHARSTGDPAAGSATTIAHLDPSLHGLGVEAAAVAAKRLSTREMEGLAMVAHQRKAEQQAAAQAAVEAQAAAKAKAEEAQAEALAARRADVVRLKAEVEAKTREAQAAIEVVRDRGVFEERALANVAAQGDEQMVLEAIFGDALTPEEGEEEEEGAPESEAEAPARAFRLKVESEAEGSSLPALTLHVRYVSASPSHLPPVLVKLEGFASPEEEEYVRLSLLHLYFEKRGPLGEDGAAIDDGEVAAGVVHSWTEWLKDEWMASQRGL